MPAKLVPGLNCCADFFVILFFISLGESLQLSNLGNVILPALALSVVVLTLKPLIVMTSLGILATHAAPALKLVLTFLKLASSQLSLLYWQLDRDRPWRYRRNRQI